MALHTPLAGNGAFPPSPGSPGGFRHSRRFQALPEGCCGPRSGCGPCVRTGRNKFPKPPGPRWDGGRGCCSWVPPTKGSWRDQGGRACCQPLMATLATHSLAVEASPGPSRGSAHRSVVASVHQPAAVPSWLAPEAASPAQPFQ